jgi:hypothetical protein
MIPVIPGSSSIVLQATHILYVAVVAAQPGPWKDVDRLVKKREVAVSFKLLRAFKGDVGKEEGTVVKAAIEQFDGKISRTFALPGAWSGKSLDADARHVVFASGAGGVAALLQAPKMVLSPDEALADVELVHEEDAQHLPLAKLLAAAQGAAPKLGLLFPEYLLQRHGAALLASAPLFDDAARLLESPRLSPTARGALLHELSSALDQHESAPGVEDRFIRALFHLLESPEARDFADEVVQVYLPNRIARRPARAVFARSQPELERARKATAARGAEAAAILEWLDAKGTAGGNP